jgi:hypothetical protein
MLTIGGTAGKTAGLRGIFAFGRTSGVPAPFIPLKRLALLKNVTIMMALAMTATPGAAQDLTLNVLDHLVVSEVTHPALPLREISALAWDEQSKVLLALSDRNDLYHLSLGENEDRIELTLIARQRLTDHDGSRLRRRTFEAEAVSLSTTADPTLAILSETPPGLSLFDL